MRDSSTVVTKKLYDDDAYLTSFTATVLFADGKDIVLDQTAFFPEEGGQSPDHGQLGGFEVEDVQIVDGAIHHFLKIRPEDEEEAKRIFRIGGRVGGSIDWEERYSNMQMHSGEHIFSGLVFRHFGYDNVGFHLSPREMTMDFEGPIPKAALKEIEWEANEAVRKNIRTKVIFPTREERESMEYRSKLDLKGPVRIVIYSGYDACACCAPHVASTAEIGLIKVVGSQNWKGGTRVSLVCGRRALELFLRDHEIVTKTAGFLSAPAESIYDLTVKSKQDLIALKAEIRDLGSQLLEAKAASIPKTEDHVVLFAAGADLKAARKVINCLVKDHDGYCAVFSGSEAEGWSYVIGSAKKDCREVGKRLKDRLSARGGGKPEMIQGSVKAGEEAIRACF